MVDELLQRSLAVDDNGTKVMFLDELKNQERRPDSPLSFKKQDGGFLYATTDLACVRHRVRNLHADRILYVVDTRHRCISNSFLPPRAKQAGCLKTWKPNLSALAR